jgi:cold shock CspA family protein
MRVQGKLTKWNSARAFGFLAPMDGGADVFVHITAFPRDGKPPVVGEVVSFEIEAGPEGKTRAVRVQRPGSVVRPRRAPVARKSRGGLRIVASLVAMVAIGGYALSHLERPGEHGFAPAPAQPVADPAPLPATSSFRCDGRTMCSQMTNCEEATWVLRNCPDTQMDGDNDGVPCERQWCD